jgi:MFS family permease
LSGRHLTPPRLWSMIAKARHRSWSTGDALAVSRALDRIKRLYAEYPRQFWLLYAGMLISATGGSMVWPFMTIFVRQRLGVPLTTVGLLLSINAGSALVATLIAGPVADRLGRKGVMVLSLFSRSTVFVAMSLAGSLPAWAVLMAASGALNPLFRVGTNAMVADLLPADRRAGAYALIRMSANVGVAIGPAVGGFIASVSYAWAFYAGAVASAAFGLLVLFFVRETLPLAQQEPDEVVTNGGAASGRTERGYARLLRDRPFLAFCAVSLLAVIPASLMFVLLPVYAKEQFGVPESQYGFVMATNAAMVVLLQFPITRSTERFPPLGVMAAGALVYALGVGSVALGSAFPHFLLSMVVLTVGEMLLVPTGTTLTANLSPPDMRGRYMGFYGLTWEVGIGVGPVIGGFLNDRIAPVAIWYGGLVTGLVATLGYLVLGRLLGAQAGENQLDTRSSP